ncbi:MAG: efflux RND transporter periplasmic adaptor subunit [Planctomycetota bacterium]|nr:MAG: efflux RND transporter periplasmic adaptor subunit [Planctomycetota bacterium]
MKKTSLLSPVLALGLAAVLLFMATRPATPAEEGPPPGFGEFLFPVTVAEIVQGDLQESLTLVGDVVAARRSDLAFERAGRVVSLAVDLGDAVKQGQLLAQLEDQVLSEQLATSQAAAAAFRVEAELAKREAARAQNVGQDVIPESERDRLTAVAQAAVHRADQSEAEVRRLQAQWEQGRLKAPYDGVVTERDLDEGAFAQAGTRVFQIVDMEHREIHLEVPSRFAAQISAGASLQVFVDEIPEFRLQGEISARVPAAAPRSRVFPMVVRLKPGQDPQRQLMPGMFVRVEVAWRAVENAWQVPADAVLESAQGSVIVKVDRDPDSGKATAAFVPIRVLARNQGAAAVDSLVPGAMAAGVSVVVTGVDNLFPGAPLATQEHQDPGQGALKVAEAGAGEE